MAVGVTVRFNPRGQAELKRVLDGLSPARNKKINRNALRTAAAEVQKVATEEMIVRGRGKAAPALPDQLSLRTGTLTRSIGFTLTETTATIGTPLIYGAAHEDPKSGQTPRPFLAPALARVAPKLDEIYARVLTQELRIA